MEKNKEILMNFENQTSMLSKLSFEEVKKLNSEILTEQDEEKKGKLRKELIEGSLHFIIDFIKSSGISNISSTLYDMDDIINSLVESFMYSLTRTNLSRAKNINSVFNSSFFNRFIDSLSPNITSSLDRVKLNNSEIDKLVSFYLNQKNGQEIFSFNDFRKYILDNNISLIGIMDNHHFDDAKLYSIYSILEGIISSLDSEENISTISPSIVRFITPILIENGLRESDCNINDVSYTGFEDSVVKGIGRDEVSEFISSTTLLSEDQKRILSMKFGLGDESASTLSNIAINEGISIERVRNSIDKSLKLLRHPIAYKVLRDYRKGL